MEDFFSKLSISKVPPETLNMLKSEVRRIHENYMTKESTKKPPRVDNVNHPLHYNTGKIEVIDAIEDWQLGFHEGNVVKYVARAKHKRNELEDLKKAKWYLDRRIAQLESV